MKNSLGPSREGYGPDVSSAFAHIEVLAISQSQ